MLSTLKELARRATCRLGISAAESGRDDVGTEEEDLEVELSVFREPELSNEGV